MPGFNRQGPMGDGPLTGRGMGMCGTGQRAGFGLGGGRGRGMGMQGRFGYRNFQNDAYDTEGTDLKSEVSKLKSIISEISKKLESIGRS